MSVHALEFNKNYTKMLATRFYIAITVIAAVPYMIANHFHPTKFRQKFEATPNNRYILDLKTCYEMQKKNVLLISISRDILTSLRESMFYAGLL